MAQQSRKCSVKDCTSWAFSGTLCRQHSTANASAGAALPGARVVNQVSIVFTSLICTLPPLTNAVQPPSPPSSSSSASVGGSAAAAHAASSNASVDPLVNYARRVLSVDQDSASWKPIIGLGKAVVMSILEAMKRAWRGCSELRDAVDEDDIEVWAELIACAWSGSRHVLCRSLQPALGCTS
jgi:hypothetical protein